MSSFLQFPGSVPWWLVLIAILPLGVYGLMVLAMPFSVFGVKGRLEAIEARLDDMHADIRSVALLQSQRGRGDEDDASDFIPPPIAPKRVGADRGAADAAEARPQRRGPQPPASRAEPRLNWPK